MAYPNNKLVNLLSKTIDDLENLDEKFNWGHFGRCNCGYLAKNATTYTPSEIHQAALEKKGEDWGVRVENYCDVSNYLIDDIIRDLFQFGLSPRDLVSIERLDDPKVLNFVEGRKDLHKGQREDSIEYFKAFKRYIESELEKEKIKV